jgi:hypothetical protein
MITRFGKRYSVATMTLYFPRFEWFDQFCEKTSTDQKRSLSSLLMGSVAEDLMKSSPTELSPEQVIQLEGVVGLAPYRTREMKKGQHRQFCWYVPGTLRWLPAFLQKKFKRGASRYVWRSFVQKFSSLLTPEQFQEFTAWDQSRNKE